MPATPTNLTWLAAPDRADHLFLAATDRCAYLAEYCVGRACGTGRLNQLVWDFKRSPSITRNDPRRAYRKRQAISTLAHWLRGAIARELVERWTWVPVPPSKQRDHPDFDERLRSTLSLAFHGYDLDLRCALRQSHSTASDHAASNRLSEGALYRMLQVDGEVLRQRPIRERLVLFDDMLTSGKHFKCCERRIRECLPQTPVLGVFLLRRMPTRAARSMGRAW